MNKLIKEAKRLGRLALFFFVCFCYIMLVMKLFVEEYSINIYVLSKALIYAFFSAKSVLIMDATPLFNWFRYSPLYVSVIFKSFLYTLLALILGIWERIISNYLKMKALAPAVINLFEGRDFAHIIGIMLGVGVVFLIYNVVKEIENYLGKGILKKIFLSKPNNSISRKI